MGNGRCCNDFNLRGGVLTGAVEDFATGNVLWDARTDTFTDSHLAGRLS